MEPSDSWSDAVEDRPVGVEGRVAARRAVDVRIEMMHKVLWLFGKLIEPVERPSVTGTTDLHIEEELRKHVCGLDSTPVDKAVVLFKLLTLCGIPSRIYMVLSDEAECFVESRILGRVREHRGRYGACVVSVDALFRARNQSYHFSKSAKHHSAVDYVIAKIGEAGVGRRGDKATVRCFEELDERRMEKVPGSIERMRRHPRYVVESLLRWDQCVYPKRPTFGTFKGEMVYAKENVVRLRTKEQLYKAGKTVDAQKPYRVAGKKKNIRLYAPWQAKELVVEGFGDSLYQDYFHENFVPVGCVYIDNGDAREVARLLGLPHRICFHGFSRGMPVNRGIFLRSRDLYVFSNFLSEYSRYTEMKKRSEQWGAGLRRWRALIRNASKYLRIRRSLGLP